MNIVEGQLELFQDEVTIKHITLDLIMEYVNRLYSTRRVHRNLKWATPDIRKQFLFEDDAYGPEGMFYWRDDLEETYYDYNDRGCMPSLWMPFSIEKKEDRYFLKSLAHPKGNDADSLKSWLSFLHNTLFYPAGVYTVGEFDIENADWDQHHSLIFTKEGMNYKSLPNDIIWDFQPEETLDTYPIIFDYISKFIEMNNLETFDFDETNYTWKKRLSFPENSYLNALKFMEDTRENYGDEIEECYDGIIYRPELTRILFCEEDIAQIDENYLETDHVGEYHEMISDLIDDLGDPEFLMTVFNARRAIAEEDEALAFYLYQNAFYERDEDGDILPIDKIDMDILRELGYSVENKEQLSLELKCSIVSAAIDFMDYEMFMCQKENGISISRDRY